ncbi:hypothetical protein GCM10007857_49180 [Bradyrhizobium iriomotense]|uniref:Type II CBASS E2 protein domain-containing protein n=1 Tax=Bradyrhizobium iriomotense TaxID=441950 RepID=A0ABQ6B6E5_9BRAD|nr:hypothetical protein GCM10007857_49180 [Bradyrhizobium iriomotense]
MTYRSVDEQDAEIRRLFPDFRLTAHADWIAVWEGPLRPASKTYRVRIVHFRRTIFEGWTLDNPYVTVHVVDPLVGAEMLANETLLPHVYWNDRNPAWPALCLWDPKEMFWTPKMSIATTIIPWTSEWLLFFEYWQISGEFLGPGRHPPRRRKECPNPPETSDPETRARRAQFRNDEFHRLGQRTGVFGSYLWMAAALRDCSQRLFSPSSNGDISAAPRSPVISISSPARQPVASSRSVSEPA